VNTEEDIFIWWLRQIRTTTEAELDGEIPKDIAEKLRGSAAMQARRGLEKLKAENLERVGRIILQ
jgi:hypothetical protein